MEILKGFEFQLQRFAAYTLKAVEVLSSASLNYGLKVENTALVARTSDSDGDSVATYANGVLTWTGTSADTVAITVGAGSELKRVTSEDGAGLTKVSFLRGNGNGIDATRANLAAVSLSGAGITASGKYEVTPVSQGTIDTPVTFADGVTVSSGTRGFTVDSGTVTATWGSNGLIVVTLDSSDSITAKGGSVYAAGTGTVSVDAEQDFTVVADKDGNGTFDAANDDKVTFTNGQKASISVDNGAITLKSGTFASVTANTTSNTIDIAATSKITVTNTVEFASGTEGKYSSTFDKNGTTITKGSMTLLAAASGNVTAGTGGNAKTLTLTTAKATIDAAGDVTGLTAGTVKGEQGASISVNKTTFAAVANSQAEVGVTALGDVALIGGTVSTTSGLKVVDAAEGETITTIAVTNPTGGNGVQVVANTGTATVTGLYAKGESVTLTKGNDTRTYTAIKDGVVKDSKDGKYYTTTEGTTFTLSGTNGTAISDAIIKTADNKTKSTYTFSSAGFESEEDVVATLKTGFSRSIEVTGKVSAGVDTTGDTISVTDKGTDTEYTLSNASKVKANGATFTTTNGVVSNATGTLLLDGTLKTLEAVGTVNVDMTSAATGKLTYQAGSSDIRDAKITLDNTANNIYLTLTEANNSSSAENTVFDRSTGTLTGLDADATILTNNVTSTQLTSIKTTGSGNFTLNKTTYVVAEDSNGVTFELDTSTTPVADTIKSIVGLDNGATVTVSGKFASDELSVGAGDTGTKFSSIETKNGITFTSTNASGNATATLYTKGDKVTYNDAIYEVTSMGSASDGVVIGNNGTTADYIGALNDGDTLKVTNVTGPSTYGEVITYEVSNNILTAKRYTSVANFNSNKVAETKTYTLTSGEDSFSVTGAKTAGWGVPGGDAGETLSGTLTFGTTNSAAATTSIVNGMYVNSSGEVSSSATKAVGQLAVTDETITYQALTDKAQTVKVTGDSSGKENWVINTRAGKDEIEYNYNNGATRNMTADATISSGAGADTIRAVTNARANDLLVDAGEGKDSITVSGPGNTTVNAGTGNDTINASGAGEYLINLDSGNNKVEHTEGSTSGNATIVGGSGNDTIKALADDVVSGGDGADTFNVSRSSMTINDYTYGTDVLQAASVAGAITVIPTNFGGDGVVSVASGVTADVSKGTGTGEFYAVSLVDFDGKNKKNVAWAKDGGSTINVTTYDQAVTLIGNADGANALYAGTKADTIYSYADNDSVYGGAGKDAISLATVASGRVVGVATTSGKDTVDGFKASFEEGDSIFMVDGSASVVKASYANNTVTFKDGEGSLQLNGVATNSTTGAVELNVSGAKVALAAASVGGAITADSTSYANFYMGNKAAVSFAAAEGEVNVDLRNGLDSGAEGAKFSGIIAVAGGAGQNTLIGGTARETLTVGTGATSLWGGAGKDTLVGNSASDVFYIGTGDGSDVVLNFSAAGNENADTVYALNDITGAKLTSNGVEISVGDTDKITLRNVTADTAIKFNSNGNAGVAKVGSATNANNFTYDSTVTYYGGGSKSDKIAFASGSTENAEVWMDGSHGKSYASIDVVDGANTSGSLLVAGDSSSQSIIGGKGDTSLWGGAGSVSDTLRSSSGSKTMFWWGAGEGNDLVVSASADDSVNFYNLKLSDVDGANSSITNSGVVLALNDGSKLTVQTSRDMTFSIDGQSWTAQHSSKEWKQNS